MISIYRNALLNPGCVCGKPTSHWDWGEYQSSYKGPEPFIYEPRLKGDIIISASFPFCKNLEANEVSYP